MKYQYKIIWVGDGGEKEDLISELNFLGAEGWELVGVNNYYAFFLKVTDDSERILSFIDGEL